ncbi:bifunctional phosphopantothenoylcysteine decarboxylase/phosphopantothenate--cysteine ligase CoaBC [Chitinophaga polysaccharea]|uniref:bifunctional phosphopantothenoylcysteine decarboxylase/phosphopantothenate--cysteine ligase CoaBC n=1 Tax=Chitinophaga polysaccharea TaxID=1293035 RepID=UPI001FFDA5B8|nr:bifunctional phosphopantothenoylcysteine decarboxylase/phosphopantothenate--cysteine ligase CoaBC [Chitinophaga polysaccharea]
MDAINMLQGKKILLGVSGSIAAYKAATLTRLLVKEGATVKVVMTPAAADFITPLTLATLSKNEVPMNISDHSSWNNHVMLGRWADVMIVAPASANTIAKMASGLCDNLLLAVYLSATCPVMFAPAMDEDMWHHPATRRNVDKLLSYGNQQIPVAAGELASGLFGEGRMAEPEQILACLQQHFQQKVTVNKPLGGKTAIVTAGPTIEHIDPVRFISNHSSGKMGIAIAEALADAGANVQLVLGPTPQQTNHPGITTTRIQTAQEMFEAVTARFSQADIVVAAAAVADYRPANVADKKIKKGEAQLHIDLEKTPDILRSLGDAKARQLLVGFSLETNNEKEYALKKLREKHLDMIVMNSLADAGAGFNYDTNKITLFDKNGREQSFPLKSKQAVAQDIVSAIIELQHA